MHAPSVRLLVGSSSGGGAMISEKQVWAALPSSGFLHSYVNWASRWVESNIAFHAVAGLALLAQSVPTDYGFPGVTPLRANMYGLLAGPSSAAGKTRAIEAAKSVLSKAIPTAEMEAPGSPEACVDGLNGHPQIIFYDEFGQFLQSTEQGQLAPLRLRLADIYDCGKQGRVLVRKRPTRKDKEENPRLSVLAGGTPGFLEAYTTEIDWMEGFLARFFTVLSTVERRLEDAAAFGGGAERDQLVEVLRGMAQSGGASDLFTSPLGACGGTSREGQRLFSSWCENLRGRAKRAPTAVHAAIHRAKGHALKNAILLAWDAGRPRVGGEWKVEADEMDAAIALTELHIESVIEIADGLAPDRDARDERAMLRAFDEVTPRTYGEALRLAKLNNRRGKEAFSTLMEKALIVRAGDSGDLTATPCYLLARVERKIIPFPAKKADPPSNLF
jgi:hypothetical protein